MVTLMCQRGTGPWLRIAKYSTEGFTEDEVLPGELGLVNRGSNFTHKLIMVGNSNAGRRSNSLLLHSIPLQYSLPQLGQGNFHCDEDKRAC